MWQNRHRQVVGIVLRVTACGNGLYPGRGICQLPPSTLPPVRLGVTVMTAPSTFSSVFS